MREICTYGSMRGRAYPTRDVPLYSTPSESQARLSSNAIWSLEEKASVLSPRDNKAKYKRMTMNSLNKVMLLLTLIGGCCTRTSFVVDEDAMYFDDGQEVLSVSQAKSCVVTEQKAAHVAEQLFIETFGNKVMGERPWRVTNRGEYFLVTGTLPHPLSLGGVAQMKIRKADGRVWVYYHGK